MFSIALHHLASPPGTALLGRAGQAAGEILVAVAQWTSGTVTSCSGRTKHELSVIFRP